jgi:nitrite reductase/ring-hydroxylating ferredoxin subunit
VKHDLFALDELPPGTMRPATVDGLAVVVVHTPDGRLHALRDTCPHEGARLSHGRLLPMVVEGDDGGYALAADDFVLRCPWHAYEFDLDSGRCLVDPERSRVRVYPVSVVDGRVTVER